ncbi:MAG: hypothetical protein ACFFE2_05555 [Candidatus Thorarchaeota archaeon]
MSSELQEIVRVVVENLHQTWIYKAIEEWNRKDALEIRKELGLRSFSITSSDPLEMYQRIKKHLLSKTFHDDETLHFLMDAPRWAGFKLNKDEFQSGQQVIGAAKDEAIALLWLMAIPKLIISPKMQPQDYPVNGIMAFIMSLMESDESRKTLVKSMAQAMETRGIPDIVFEPSPIGRGYSIDETMRVPRLRSLLAMVIMRSTGCPFDLDQVFTLDEEELIEETSAYIVANQARAMLKNQITGMGARKPFDWPLIGNPNICSKLVTTLEVFRQYAANMKTCSLYMSETAEGKEPWTKHQFVSYLLGELTDHYSEIHRVLHGRSKNIELDHFIRLLTGENIEISKRILDSSDPGTTLFEELANYKQKARIGDKPKISPERRFRIILSSLAQRVSDDKTEKIPQDEVIEQIIEAFDAIIEMVESYKTSLGEESERFAQALCFETAYRILQLLDVGEAIMDVPWVSRFIAEESARSDIATGDIDQLDDEYRIRRIVSAYAGGLTYLFLQSSKE